MTERPGTLNRHRLADLGVLVILAALVVLYCVDSVQASRSIYNLIFVLPVGILVLLLCAGQFVMGVRTLHEEGEQPEPITDVLPVILLFAGYVLSLHWLGFDVGTIVFIGLFLWLHGERRLPWLAAYAISFGILVALFFSMMLPYPMPMLILGSAY